MKRQEAFDRMRKNRDTARNLALRREVNGLLDKVTIDQKRWDDERQKQEARQREFDARIGAIGMSFALSPFWLPDVEDELTRLGNEYGLNGGKPRTKLTVVGGSQC